ncbi:winged helix-turn-helix transcriptional regulator [Candidatus Woesearchaeota archaeon]|jgi:DNA-binding transcriptional ArsR family regulator|nr:winged helix-turn-helix transcriptional regulator [Candidatus Woesearchaeota archaeon]MBT4368532.1 winged helix-turn-helix transcriptional regulator [Candidatus Woesearchaeota archaeon]MBT4713021.1 winged helix-turn-helix transcriptional regulator [Candidatus Woesearchaeota archaeon]MBT6639933.1 winged helix-turn-helix transcriptional regulator [Candidatus Woesearchaeota archaeon]MBT7134105.1 winged helix-turn-helix transcriptional regulator [Candidatus Woesearchaeota archaeon]
MTNLIIAPVGDYMENLFIGLREFPAARVVLLATKNQLEKAKETQVDLDKFKIATQIIEIEGSIWEAFFQKIAELKRLEKDQEIIVNTATGNRLTQCAVTSAAFVNGLKAISVENEETVLLPVLKFSYYKLLTDKKMEILKHLGDESCCASLDELATRTGMSMPLISYHVNGNLKSEGLKELGLVDTLENKGRTDIRISTLGRLLLKGYITSENV